MNTIRRLYAHSCRMCPLRGGDRTGACGFLADNPVTDDGFPTEGNCPMAEGDAVLVSRSVVAVVTPAELHARLRAIGLAPEEDR